MNRIKKTVSLLAALCLLLAALPISSSAGLVPFNAEGECGENLTWFYDSSLRILYISGEGGMDSYTYSARSPWNRYRTYIREIVVEEGVTSLGALAFYECSALTSVSLPGSLTVIGSNAFSNCTSLNEVTVPDSVTEIASGAFQYCRALYSVSLGSHVTSIGNYGFASCSLDEIALPGSLLSIGDYAFSACYFTSVSIPNSVTQIGVYAFDSCNSLVSAEIGAGLTSSAEVLAAFDQCPYLEEFIVSAANPALSSPGGVLMNKDCSTLIKFPRGKAGGYTVPASVTTIADGAFSYCSALTSVVVPDTVTMFDGRPFYRCDSLVSITIGDGVTEIADSAFYDCASLKTVVIGDGVISVGSNVFTNCTSLVSITFGRGLASIDYRVLDNCGSLTSITFLGAPPQTDSSSFPQDLYYLSFYYTSDYAEEWAPYGATFCGYPLIMIESPEPQITPGDINGDGELGFTDVSALYGFALGLGDFELPLEVGDINCDGEITFADVGALYARIIG